MPYLDSIFLWLYVLISSEIAFSFAYSSAKQFWPLRSSSSNSCARKKSEISNLAEISQESCLKAKGYSLISLDTKFLEFSWNSEFRVNFNKICSKNCVNDEHFLNPKVLQMFIKKWRNFAKLDWCKRMHTSCRSRKNACKICICLQRSALIQPRTSPPKFELPPAIFFNFDY